MVCENEISLASYGKLEMKLVHIKEVAELKFELNLKSDQNMEEFIKNNLGLFKIRLKNSLNK